jgi:hypothetical protein
MVASVEPAVIGVPKAVEFADFNHAGKMASRGNASSVCGVAVTKAGFGVRVKPVPSVMDGDYGCFRMKGAKLAIACALGAAVLLGAAPDPWKRYSYPKDGYSVESPMEPQLTSSQHENKRGPYEIHQYMMDLGNDQAALVDVAELGPIDNPQAVLEASRDGSLKASPNTVLKYSKLGTYAGRRSIDFEAEDATYHLRGRYIVANTRLMGVIGITPKSAPMPPAIDRIFKSVRFIGK